MERVIYLLDTNAVIDYLGRKFPVKGMEFMHEVVNAIPNISVISKIEVLGFNSSNEHHKFLSDFIQDAALFNLTDEVIENCIQIRRSKKIKTPDAIIAATALAYDFALITNNEKDFVGIEGLEVFNPHKL